MKITILTAGFRGDVQPYIALAQGLGAAGHDVTLAGGTNFESFVMDYGVKFAPLRADYFALTDSPEGQALKSGNPIKAMQTVRTSVLPMLRHMLDDAWVASENAEMMIYHPKALAGMHIAEKLNIPCLMAMAVPVMRPTAAFPVPGIFTRNLGGAINRLTYSMVNMATAPFNGIIGDWREQVLGLPRKSRVIKGFSMRGRPVPMLHAYSQHVLRIPTDWDDTVHVTGYWFLDSGEWTPPEALTAFLNAGDAPVYVGFGSMVAGDPERLTRNVIDGLVKAGTRGVIATGWGGIKDVDLPSSIFKLTEAPHDWLFPRMAAVVHHGGAGTTAAGLRAGKPTMVVPFMIDQPFWGARLYELVVAPKPISQKKLTADLLADGIQTLMRDTGMCERAENLGTKIRAEDGVANAVQIIEGYSRSAPARV